MNHPTPHLLHAPIRRTTKTLACVHCGTPVPVDAQATRCVCGTCTTAGRILPRTQQADLHLDADLNLQPA